MKVLYISHDGASNGGAGLALLELIDDAMTKGITPYVIIPNQTRGMAEELKRRGIEYFVYPHYWWAFCSDNNLLRDVYKYILLYVKQMIMILRLPFLLSKLMQYDIDLIHTNSSVINLGLYLKLFLKKPHIWHVREFGEEHHNFKYIFGRKYTRKIMAWGSEILIVISDGIYNKYAQFIKKEKIIRVYDGLSNKYQISRDSKRRNNYFEVLICGSIQKGKGQLEILQAIKKILDMGIEVNLTIAGGTGEPEYLSKIKEYISENKLNNHVNLLGQCKDMNKLRKNMDVEVSCSVMEGFGRVTVEALLSKLPIIVSNSGANVELIEHKYNGLIYELGNIDDLVQQLLFLYYNPSECDRMSRNGYQVAINNYTQDINTNNIIKIYNKLIQGGKI